MSEMYIEEIRRFLPHRYPFLLVDRVIDCVPGETLTAIKNVTVNEPHFTGHFPDQAIMPGVLIIEALAQVTGLLGFRTMSEEPSDEILYMLVGIDGVRFKRQVVPGDQLMLKAKIERRSKVIWKFSCEASVDGELCTAASLLCAASPKEA
ncbi:MAG: 3-hydroxyacyl-[acyl-carrier-protein] dehydratase FabZ [Thiotrichaceae bacterium]|nr:MAG: 3-hydroxyacyl-[acyl-carrier-protein] dehydratase FabZ [Thiotrichaceae bacterium]